MPTDETFLLADDQDPTKQPRESSQLEKLLNWLVHHWSKNTITLREIYDFGPRPRDRKRAIELTEILAKNGWLIHRKTSRRDRFEWEIVRGPTPLVLFLPKH
jgi:hypothetical protein